MLQKTQRKKKAKNSVKKIIKPRSRKVAEKKTARIKQFKDRFAEYAQKALKGTQQKLKEIIPVKSLENKPKKTKEVYQESVEPVYHLAEGYGDNRLVLMVRDPHWIFSYWEITLAKIQELREKIGRKFSDNNLTLRVFQQEQNKHFDINVISAGIKGSWYIKVGIPDTTFSAQIGYLSLDGQFHPLVTSNTVKTPRDRISDVIDEEWMIPDWEKLFTLSGESAVRRGSEEISEMLSRYINQARSSEAISSSSRELKK